MKKLFLLTIAALASWGAQAQMIDGSSVVGKMNKPVNERTFKINPSKLGSSNKGTAGDGRWFRHIDIIEALNGAPLENAFCPIWPDTMGRQVLTNSSGIAELMRVNFSSYAQTFQVQGWENHGSRLWAESDVFTDDPIVVSGGNAFTVDTISFNGAYVKIPSRPDTVVDTLIIAIGVGSVTYRYPTANPDYTWAQQYIPSGKDTLYVSAPGTTDAVNRTVGRTGSGAYETWKVPITDAMRDTQGTVLLYTLPVPNGGLQVPANGMFAYSVTFKSGDEPVTLQDTFTTARHHFYMVSHTIGSNANMMYRWYEYGDKNSSSLMFSWVPTQYAPSVVVEGNNPAANFRFEYHQMFAHVVCPTCVTLDVNNVTAGNITTTAAYPNPAITNVYVPFKLKTASDVKISLTNALGQTVKSVTMNNVDKGQPEFNVSDLAAGVYLYVVEANGERATGRISVAH